MFCIIFISEILQLCLFVLLQPFLFSKSLLLAPLYYLSDKKLLALLIQLDTS